jgi:hypothetical protein
MLELIRQLLYNCIRAVNIGLIQLPLGGRQPLTRVVEARMLCENGWQKWEDRSGSYPF